MCDQDVTSKQCDQDVTSEQVEGGHGDRTHWSSLDAPVKKYNKFFLAVLLG